MFEINNSSSHLKFLRKEKIMRRAFYFVVLVYFTVFLIQDYKYFYDGNPNSWYFFIVIFETYIPLLLLLTSCLILSCYMNKYHKYEYKEIQWSLIAFVLIESIDSVAVIVRILVGESKLYHLVLSIYVFGGGYVLV